MGIGLHPAITQLHEAGFVHSSVLATVVVVSRLHSAILFGHPAFLRADLLLVSGNSQTLSQHNVTLSCGKRKQLHVCN